MTAPGNDEAAAGAAVSGQSGGARYVGEVVVTGDDSAAVLRPGALDVVGERLVRVGPIADAPPPPGPVHDLGGLLMPGLVNTHAHSAMTLFRSAGDGLPLDEWLREVIWPRESHLTADDVYWGMTLGAHEMLSCGVTTTCEMYLHDTSVVDAVVDAGIRCVVTPGIFDLPHTGESGRWQSFLERAVALHDTADGRQGLVTVGLGPHSVYVLPPDALRQVAKVASELGVLLHLHLAETRGEVAQVRDRHGCSGPELLERLGVLECRCLAAHSVWLEDDDLARYRAFDVAVAHCPGSNAKLGSGVARLREMLDLGLRVGVGTDGPASNDDLDLWQEMRLAPELARAVGSDPDAVSTEQAFALGTRGGASALGVDTGVLAPGRLADFIRLDLDDTRFVPGEDSPQLLAHVVWAGQGSLVTDAWVGGRHVVSDGTCTSVDGARARSEVRRRSARLREAAGH